jgi:hypothetical protein
MTEEALLDYWTCNKYMENGKSNYGKSKYGKWKIKLWKIKIWKMENQIMENGIMERATTDGTDKWNILTDLINATAPKITRGLRNLRLVEGGTLL